MAQVFETKAMDKMYILKMVNNNYGDATILEVSFDLDTVMNERNEHINAIVDKQFQKFEIHPDKDGKEWIKTIRVYNVERDEMLTFEIMVGIFTEL